MYIWQEADKPSRQEDAPQLQNRNCLGIDFKYMYVCIYVFLCVHISVCICI
jgi:hypothetical protein